MPAQQYAELCSVVVPCSAGGSGSRGAATIRMDVFSPFCAIHTTLIAMHAFCRALQPLGGGCVV